MPPAGSVGIKTTVGRTKVGDPDEVAAALHRRCHHAHASRYHGGNSLSSESRDATIHRVPVDRRGAELRDLARGELEQHHYGAR